jgi:hypothetical protein
MLRALEILLLQFIEWFYSLSPAVGLGTLGVAGVTGIIAQLLITGNSTFGKTMLPGLLGVFLLAAESAH